MKLTGLGALACAGALTLACAGDARNDQDNEASRSGTIYGGDATPDQTAEREGPGDSQARIGAAGEDPSSVATGTSGQAGIREAATTTRQFVEKAAIAGTAEIELGQLARERAQHADVKAFGQMMVTDHTRGLNELKQAVSGHDIDISKPQLDPKHQQLLSRLRNLRGAEFDREYMMAMVDGHKDVHGLLQSRTDLRNTRTGDSKESQEARTHGGANPAGATGTTGTSDAKLEAAVDQWAMKALPSVEKHLERAQQVRSGLGQ